MYESLNSKFNLIGELENNVNSLRMDVMSPHKHDMIFYTRHVKNMHAVFNMQEIK